MGALSAVTLRKSEIAELRAIAAEEAERGYFWRDKGKVGLYARLMSAGLIEKRTAPAGEGPGTSGATYAITGLGLTEAGRAALAAAPKE
jgi:hypothetical protein